MKPDPGLPTVRTLARRHSSRQIHVGDVRVAGGAPASVQTMTTTLTADGDATLQQIAAITAAGCDIVRVAVPSQDDADALPAIVAKSPIPVDAETAEAASAARVPLRIGVNASSLDPRLLTRHGAATPDALVESAQWECSLFEEHGFRELKNAVKHHDPITVIEANRILAESCDYPLHLGVTEAGPAFQVSVKSAVALGVLLAEGIGDTIRVSLSAPPVEQVKAGIHTLQSLGVRPRKMEIVSCPGCGRLQADIHRLANRLEAAFYGFPHPLRISVMGCVVNGPGEAGEADIGVSSGNGKGQIFVHGHVVATVPESNIVDTLLQHALRLADAPPAKDTESSTA
ncbi:MULTISPECIES: flavodoxin-dependent (E)-4-hydroxy-3-methylbut-2-enyl-diphosphate synthase [unclassified Streptomyces]|uniref:flavodoxin-dependent (E)-4-hydroxy-3-methylbut-2-enyl-diphosphate synthase n=1 Tax=unclassified Streptomyces TaxID=2593676 RepID=UPI0033240176